MRSVGERQPEILRHAVDLGQHSLLGQLGADGARRIERVGAVRELELLAVREDYVHGDPG